jgi:hypothetical protein
MRREIRDIERPPLVPTHRRVTRDTLARVSKDHAVIPIMLHVTLGAPKLEPLVLRKKVLLALRVLRHDVTIQTLSILNTLKRRKVTPLTIVFNHAVRVRDRTTTPLTVPPTHKRIGETSSEH